MNTIPSSIEMMETDEYGPVLKCRDLGLADEIEDYLTEECFVLFQVKLEPQVVQFYFGQAGSVAKISELVTRFFGSRSG